jgi:hypothetical protein
MSQKSETCRKIPKTCRKIKSWDFAGGIMVRGAARQRRTVLKMV